MAELVKVVVDAMGGDYAPVEPVKAAVEAVKERLTSLPFNDYFGGFSINELTEAIVG